MTAARDPYAVLGLQPGASPAEVKRAYRRLAKVLHPDSAGERSLPAFLAVQEAYERLTGTRVRTVRPPGSGGGPGNGAGGPVGTGGTSGASGRSSGSSSGSGFREPWRADPDRARAAREQARARRTSPSSGAASGGGGAAAGAAGAAGTTGATGEPGRRARDPGGGQRRTGDPRSWASGSDGRSGAGASSGRRRRPTRKATMGSTSYDEARDASDPRWAGASWYGPTTGEYWIVNPREYADPRKHGPGYSSRVRSGPSIAEPDVADVPPMGDAGASAPVAPESDSEPSPARRQRPATVRPTATSAAEAGRPTADPATGPSVDAILRTGTSDPLRRLGLVLLAWAPIGIAAAGVIGDATGCATYSTACDGTDPFLPWVAQAVVLGLLLLIPALTRVLAAGSVAIVLGLIPATALVIAFGGARSAAAGAVLGGALALAWLGGVAWGTWRLLRRGAAGSSGA